MDKYETLSNVSTSNLSSISGLTGYEEEINEIRNLINLSSSEQKAPVLSRHKENPETFSYEIRISNLTSELQNTLKLNEKYKNDLFNLQRQQDLNYHEKFEKLLKKSSYLEAQLENANILIANLKRQSFNGNALQKRISVLEIENFDLKSRITERESELDLLRNDNATLVSRLRGADLKASELEEGIKIKSGCVDELKRKIGEQHIEIQELMRKNVGFVNSFSSVQNELDSHKKSLQWYKKRVEESHEERNKLTVELSETKLRNLNKNQEIEKLKGEIDDWKCKYRELNVIYERDKNYYNEVKERETVDKNLAKSLELNKSIDAQLDVDNMRIFYEKEIADITNEMLKVRKAIDEQNCQYDKIIKENAELHSRNTMFQKMLNDKEIQLEIDRSSKADLMSKYEEAFKSLSLKEKEVLEMKTNVEKTELKLGNVIKERDELTEATVTIRRDFQKFLNLHKDLKMQLDDKNKLLMDLQKHKQELFMQNNWSVCELEEFKNKEKDYLSKINDLSRETVERKHNLKNLETLASNLQKTTDDLKIENENLKRGLSGVDLLRKQVDELNASISDYEHKIVFYKQSIEELNVCVSNSERSVRVKENDLKIMRTVFGDFVEILCQKFDKVCNSNFELTTVKDDLNNIYKNNKVGNDNSGTNENKLLYNNNLADYFNENVIRNAHNGLPKRDFNYSNPALQTVSNPFNDLNNPINFFDDLKAANKNSVEAVSNSAALLNDDDFKEIIEKVDASVLKFKQYFLKQKNDINKRRIFKMGVFKGELYERLKMLEDRSYLLTEKCLRTENAFCKLELDIGKGMIYTRCDNEDILKLQAVIKVKDLEIEEKRKRYQLNVRTLLRKVKEHMRGRNNAEKQCKYLQDLYNSTMETLNSTKLLLNEREYEIEGYKKAVENKEKMIEKLQNAVASLEKETNKKCTGCIENAELKSRLNDVEVKLISAENSLDVEVGKVKAKEVTIESLKKQLNDFAQQLNATKNAHTNCDVVIKKLTEETNETRAKSAEIAKRLDAIQEKYEHLNSKYANLQVENTDAVNTIKLLEFEKSSLTEKNGYFAKEIEMVNCTLHQKDEEIVSLKSQKVEKLQKQEQLQDLLKRYESDLKDMQNAVTSVNREKYFLQRLSNDLKVALNITLRQNQNLKEKLSAHNKDADFRSLPEFLSNLPAPSNYDDTHVRKLVQITDNLEKQKPPNSLHESLNSLKREMSALQQQIEKKKYAASSL